MTSRLAESPIDKLSGLPLPFAPNSDLPPVPAYIVTDYDRHIADFHHPYHPRIALLGSAGESAVRSCRIQWVMRSDHNAFHANWGGPPLPETEAEQYKAAVIAATGYIPTHGLYLGNRSPFIVQLTARERQHLRTSGQIRLGHDGLPVRDFLMDIAMKHGAHEIDARRMHEFLDLATDPSAPEKRQLELARAILLRGVNSLMTDDIKRVYARGRVDGAIRSGLPRGPVGFVCKEIVRGVGSTQEFIGSIATKCLPFWGQGRLAT